jgi:type II secretory pathway predicted ATPase ExeA
MHGTLSLTSEAGDAANAPRGRTGGSRPPARDPFLNRPSPDLFFAAEPHRAAWTFLRRALRRGVPFVLLTGDFGAGKTMLTLRLVQAIRDHGLGPCVHMSTPAQGAAPLLRRTAEAAGLDPETLPEDAAGLAEALHARLIDDPPEQRLFLVLEDPQDLEAEALELLLRAVPTARDGRAALTAVLIGHSSLPRLLQGPRFRRFDARIRKRHHLAPMDAQQTRAYIAFRLSQAGAAQSPLPDFDDAALDRVFELTRGNPREINNVCGTSLSQAVARQRPTVDREMVDEAARALGRPVPGVERAAPVVVQFPSGAQASRTARGAPDYVRTYGSPALNWAEPPAPAPLSNPPANRAPDRAADRAADWAPDWADSTTGARAGTRAGAPKPAWHRDPRLRAAAAGGALLLAVAYVAAPYLTTDRSRGPAGEASGAQQSALSQSERREIEALLRSLDFETGPVDGRLDPKTQDAVQAYKGMAGLTPADPKVGRDLLEDLRAVTGNLSRPDAGPASGSP